MLCLRLLIPAAAVLGFLAVCRPMTAHAPLDVTARAARFVKEHETRLRPLEIAGNLAWWKANTTGNEDDFKMKEAAQNAIDTALADTKVFAELKDLREK